MMHTRRRWTLALVDLAEAVRKLTEYDFTSCAGFRIAHPEGGSILVLNDSTCADALQEYAVFRLTVEQDVVLARGLLKDPSYVLRLPQIESLTVSWMKPRDLYATLEGLLLKTEPEVYGEFDVRIDAVHNNSTAYWSCCA
jgi:hypothetical protein